uniref:Ig-like domain-containing protein n=1 Tax=Sphaeramia orbicularis TaxID=375764 RepID=A0A673C4L2_9TELE
ISIFSSYDPGSSPSLHIPSKRPKVTNNGTSVQDPAPPVFTRKLRKAAVGTGCDIRLRVTVAGFPKPALTWYHNDELISPSEAQDSGGLWIRDCRTSDAGLYTCVATNELGEANCSAVLAVMDLGEATVQCSLLTGRSVTCRCLLFAAQLKPSPLEPLGVVCCCLLS